MKNFLINFVWYIALLALFRLVGGAPWFAAVGFSWVIAKIDPLVDD